MTKKIYQFIDKHLGIIFLIPGLSVIVFILAYPVITNIFISFTNKHLIYRGYKFVGFENYIMTFKEDVFNIALFNTFIFTFASIILQLLIGLITALILNKPLKGIIFFRLALIIPYAIPPIVIAMLWKWLLSKMYGVYNFFLMNLNFIDQPVPWLGHPDTSMIATVVVNVWFGFPLFTLGILAGLQSIPSEQYEVARIEGANWYQTFWYVTLPNILTIVGIIIILRTIWVFNTFDLVYVLTGGGPLNSTMTLPIYSYIVGWKNGLLGETAAVAMFLFFILMIFTFFYFRLFKIDEDQYGKN